MIGGVCFLQKHNNSLHLIFVILPYGSKGNFRGILYQIV